MTTDYVLAPATALVATHCALCGRPLLDAPSVERGVGPTCAAKYGYDRAEGEPSWPRATAAMGATGLEGAALAAWGVDARAAVNALVHAIATSPSDRHTIARVEAVRALGFGRLADRLSERLTEGLAVIVRADGSEFVVAVPFDETFRASLATLAPGRRWDSAAKVYRVPSSQKRGLWVSLLRAFRGRPLITDAGVSVIEGRAA